MRLSYKNIICKNFTWKQNVVFGLSGQMKLIKTIQVTSHHMKTHLVIFFAQYFIMFQCSKIPHTINTILY